MKKLTPNGILLEKHLGKKKCRCDPAIEEAYKAYKVVHISAWQNFMKAIVQPVKKIYAEAINPAWQAYFSRRSTYADYIEATASAKKALDEAVKPFIAEYLEATASARKALDDLLDQESMSDYSI
jgi:hypothetical protein